ncbi:MAG: hypothetical protein HC904_02390 [Blastochloris sp.]|nr:hypothetical protein [Blastochloris sp.]
MTKAPYHAKPDGKTDCTAAIQQALTDFSGRGMIYLPNGTYVISDTLRWMREEKRNILQGQSKEGTIIRLQDKAPGFGNPSAPKAMIYTGRKPAQRFRNGIRNLTIDSGRGNPGAIGAQFIANNQGGIHHVIIRSGDGSGPMGLDLAYTPEEGPFLVSDLQVIGFDVGIANSCPVDSVTFENLRLEKQNRLGMDIDSQVITIRHLTSRNAVPAIRNHGVGVLTLIESEIIGLPGAEKVAAITNENAMFARGVKASGYARLVDNLAGTGVGVKELELKEFISHPPHLLFPSRPESLRLPIKETPEVPWDDPETWTDVTRFGPPRMVTLIRASDGKSHATYDWSEALQKAIDSGATTIYFPNREADQNKIPSEAPEADLSDEEEEGAEEEMGEKPVLSKKEKKKQEKAAELQEGGAGTETRVMVDGKSIKVKGGVDYGIYGTVYLRNKVKRIIGCESELARIVNNTTQKTAYQAELVPTFVLEEGEAPVVVFERFNTWYASPSFVQKSKRTLLISSMSFYEVVTEPGAGDVFLEDVRIKHIHVKGSNVWARQVNPEGWHEPRVLVEGGSFWVLGLKTETDATIGIVRAGGKAEVVGGFFYANKGKLSPKQMWINEDSDLSLTYGSWKTKRGKPFDVVVRETRNGVMREIRHEDALPRGEAGMVALYTGSKPTSRVQPEKPSGLRLEAQGTSSLRVSWTAVQSEVDGLALEREKSPGVYELAQVLPVTAQSTVVSGLKAGTEHAFRLKAFSAVGEMASEPVRVSTVAVSAPGKGTGLKGVYFDDLAFKQAKGERLDPGINFEWKQEEALPGLKAERYAVRWIGQVESRVTEPVTFIMDANFGARLFVNDTLLFDTLHNFDGHLQRGRVAMVAGEKARLRLEYHKRETPGLIKLSWKSVNQPEEIVPVSQLYPEFAPLTQVGLSPESLTLKENVGKKTLELRRTGGSMESPLVLQVETSGNAVEGQDYVLDSKTVEIPAGQSVAMLGLNVVDNAKGNPSKTVVLQLKPQADQLHAGARSSVTIEDDDMPAPGKGTGWKASFFQGANFETPVGTKVLSKSDFYWDKKPPHPGVDPTKPYSIRWEAKVQPLFSETYSLKVLLGGNGGARLWVDGKLLVDLWEKEGVNTVSVKMEAGKSVDLKVEMRQNKFYGARLGVEWSSPSQYLQAIPATELFPAP